jgi:uncharacterized membrane protein (DUF2068 family)
MQLERRVIRSIAAVEGMKGAIVMLAGMGAFALIHHDVQAFAEMLVRHSHLNPARYYPQIFVEAAGRLHDPELRLFVIGALAYASVRFVEAYGLWRDRVWAEWLAAASGGIYLPVELYELFRGVTWIKAAVFLINAAVVTYMIRILILRRGAS